MVTVEISNKGGDMEAVLLCGPEKLPKNDHSRNVLMERREGARKIPGEKKMYLPSEVIGSGNCLI